MTIWTCLAFDEGARHARYLRTTPASRVAFVDVRCEPENEGTLVAVEYSFAALNDAGAAYIDELSQEQFADMIREWKALIEAV